jgi:hypothetical protein
MIMESLRTPILCGVWALLLLGIAVGAPMGQIAYSQPPKNDSLTLIDEEDNPKGSFADWNTRVNCDRERGD